MLELNPISWPTARPHKAAADFVRHVNMKINATNQLINLYNRRPSVETFKPIYKAFCEFENAYSADLILACPSYQATIHNQFFRLIEGEAERLQVNLTDLREDAAIPDTFSPILAQMSPQKVSEMIKRLTAFDYLGLAQLYQRDEKGYKPYLQFIKSHNITFLGGGNSLNFKVTHLRTGAEFVIKIDNRLGMPKNVEQQLRQHEPLKNTFVPVYIERHATFYGRHGMAYRTLQTTELLQSGDLETHAMKYKPPEKRVEEALDIYMQMADILSNITAAGAASPDMKNSNWLIDDQMKVRIADTKGLIPTQRGFIDSTFLSEQWYEGLLHTSFMIAPEMHHYFEGARRQAPVRMDANKMHAYLFGKNLYQYLTKCPSFGLTYLPTPIILPQELGEAGAALQGLLRNLLQTNPSARYSMSETLATLKSIRATMVLKQCASELETIKRLLAPNCYQQIYTHLRTQMDFRELGAYRKKLQEEMIPTLKSEEAQALKAFIEQLSRPTPRTDLYAPQEIINIQKEHHSLPLGPQYNRQTLANRLAQLQLDMQIREAKVYLRKIQTLNYGVITPEIQQYCVSLQATINQVQVENPALLSAINTRIKDAYERFFKALALPFTDKFYTPQDLSPQLHTLLQTLIPIHATSPTPKLEALTRLKVNYYMNECHERLNAIKPFLLDSTYLKLESSIKEIKSDEELVGFQNRLEALRPALASDEAKALRDWVSSLQPPAQREGLYNLAEYASLAKKVYELPLQEGANLALFQKTKLEVERDLLLRQCKKIIRTVSTQGFGENDELIKARCEQMTKELNEHHKQGLDALRQFKATLEQECHGLRAHQAQQIKQVIQDFRQRASFFTVGMKAKANRIESAMANVPLAERGNILRGTSQAAIAVREALASHRHWHKRRVYRHNDNTLDETKAASTYLTFKRREEWVERQRGPEDSPPSAGQPNIKT